MAIVAAGFFSLGADSKTPEELNDLEIARVAYTAGRIDIRYAHLALALSKNPEIRDFAETMIRDHSAVNRSGLVPHTVTADNGAWESGTLDAGDSWRLAVDNPAMLPAPYYCRHRPDMCGALVTKQNHISIPKADRLSAEINHAGEST